MICKDVEELRKVEKALELENNEHLIKDRKVKIFEQFDRNHSATAADLRSLKMANFIVLTTQQGAIGVDYQGTSVSHPIITYAPANNSQLI